MSLTHKEITAILLTAYGSLDNAVNNDSDEGICHNCGHIQSGVEPGISCYLCEVCGQDTVLGVEDTIINML